MPHQIFVMHFHLIAAQRHAEALALAREPFPEKGTHQEVAAKVSRQGTNISKAVQGGGDCRGHRVDDKNIGNHLLDQRKIEQVQRRGFGPPLHTLFAGDRFPHDAQEIVGIVTIFQHPLLNIFEI